MMRTTAATVVVLASLLAAVVPAVHALGTGGAWNQIHHDPRNSGRVPWTSSFQDGACPAWTVYANQTYGPEVIQANGVLGLKGNYMFYVGNAPGAYIVHKVDVATGIEVDLFVNTFKELDVNAVGSVAVGIVPVVPPVPPQVAAAKPQGVGITDDYNDVFYAFGHDVYSLSPSWNWQCVQPIYAPLRLSPAGGILFVTCSNATNDSDGSLHALDAQTGKELWNYTTSDGKKSWGMRITPAVTEAGVVFVCYGPAMVALDAYNGTVLAKTTTYPLLAVLGSSPVVTQDGLKVFLQSKTDDLWRFDVSQNAIGPGLTIQQNWVCRYSSLVPDCVALNTTMDEPQLLDESQLSDHFRALLHAPAPEPGQPLPRSLQPRYYDENGVGWYDVGDDNRATPALGPADESIIFPLYTTTPGMGGVHSANTDDGSRNWRYLSTEDSQYLGDMMGRSSPAVDEGGNVFIGMDQVVQGEGQVPPVLLALNNQGERVWVDPGVQPGPIYNPIGLRSPMMGYEEAGSPATARVYFSRTGIVQAFSPGITCPSTDPLKTCSGHGICGCTTGHCACEVLDCFYGDDCGTEQTCSENGDCLDGVCVCTNPCFSGQVCDTPNTCSARGTCGETGCQCESACFYGADCEDVRDCSGQGECNLGTGLCQCHEGITGPNCEHRLPPHLPGSGGMGAGWVLFIVAICLWISGTVGYMVFWKRRTGEWWIYRWRVVDVAANARTMMRRGRGGETQPLAGNSSTGHAQTKPAYSNLDDL